jgi:hypothetical protein
MIAKGHFIGSGLLASPHLGEGLEMEMGVSWTLLNSIFNYNSLKLDVKVFDEIEIFSIHQSQNPP